MSSYENETKKVILCVLSPPQWAEYILFAALLVLVCIIFAIMAYFYTYIDPAKIEAHFANMEYGEKERKKSLEMAKKASFQHQDEDNKSSDSSSDEEEESKQSKMWKRSCAAFCFASECWRVALSDSGRFLLPSYRLNW